MIEGNGREVLTIALRGVAVKRNQHVPKGTVYAVGKPKEKVSYFLVNDPTDIECLIRGYMSEPRVDGLVTPTILWVDEALFTIQPEVSFRTPAFSDYKPFSDRPMISGLTGGAGS